MSYGTDEVQRDFKAILQGAVSFETRAQLEQFLLATLTESGDAGVAQLLGSLSEFGFARDATLAPEVRYISRRVREPALVITTFITADVASVNVTVEAPDERPVEPLPEHRAFYALWEKLLGCPDPEVPNLTPERRAVFLVGLLQAEVMNGGFGQYLTNTEGVHVDDTIHCLAEIGAVRTRALLLEAQALIAEAPSPVAAWEARSAELQRLDERFLEAGEDLAGLTAVRFLGFDAGGSV